MTDGQQLSDLRSYVNAASPHPIPALAPLAIPACAARHDDQKSRRRAAILDAADRLLREEGFDTFAMAPLARRAGIAKGTLYLYFETR